MKIKKNQKIIIGAIIIVLAALFYLKRGNVAAQSPLNTSAFNTGGGSVAPYIPSSLPPLNDYSRNVPWWLQNNNSPLYQGVPLLPIALPTNSDTGCNTCSLMNNSFFGGQL